VHCETSCACPVATAGIIASPRRFDVVRRGDARRAQVEDFIATVYRSHYGGRIPCWAPTLVTSSIDGRLAAGAGYRPAGETLYLERYLAMPVEHAIAAHAGTRVDRNSIVEVGHFASSNAGEGRRLMRWLAGHLAGLGCRWVVCTATRELRELLVRLGVRPYALAPADPAQAGEDAADWGRYYDHLPVVIAGDLLRSLAVLARR
jgi:hypothetical protein